MSFPPIPCSEEMHPAGSSSSRWSDRRLRFLLAFMLAIGTAAVYAPSVRNGFVNFDDPDYVTRNAHVLQGVTWPNLMWSFGTSNPAANWHPLTWISHMIDVQWYGINPAGHHFNNVLLHTLNVAILFVILQRATGHTLRSAAVAAVFGLHPLNVESVAWVAERKAVLSVFFLLLTLWAYVWYACRPALGRYVCVMLFFAAALMAKIMVIALPAGLLLLDYWPLRRLPGPAQPGEQRPLLPAFLILGIEKIPLLLLAGAGGWMTMYMHRKEGALAGAMPFSWRLRNVIYSYLAYLGKAIWPSRLAVFYPHPENSLAWWKVIAAALVLVGVSIIVWRFRERRYLLIGWLWYLGTMFPMVGMVQSGRQGMADRYMYIPLIGLIVASVWLLGDLAGRVEWKAGFLAAVFLLVATSCIYLTRTQIGYWRDSYTLFTHTLQITKNNGIAENNLGSALVEMGQAPLAALHFEAAVRLIPELASAHYNLGQVLQTQNRTEEAAREYQLAIAASSDALETAQAHNNLGILYMGMNNSAAALTELNAAIVLNPYELNSYIGRGIIELQSWNLDAAVADFSRAAAIAPSPTACFWLGRALETKGDFRRAANAYEAALQLAPGFIDAQARLQALQSKAGERR
ncbi:MAG TPA: tetratricopeptide repeat protein [Candidatus Dormibacteraeota bacterium]|nr:tetratricopeptide repeat protein [Candidatus Dormibacteraeota bacterium]